MKELPIDEILPAVIRDLTANNALVLQAEPGAGKTTRVPAAILDSGLCSKRIIVLQPRRLAARSAAERIAAERGTTLGSEIGYQVRLDSRFCASTKILFCTEGIFLRIIQADPTLDGIDAVIFDEFHERNILSDLALSLTKQVQESLRADLRILVMSATLDPVPVSRYLGNCPVHICPGRLFPVDIQYMEDSSLMPLGQITATAIKSMLNEKDGDILVFLPGLAEIRETETILNSLIESDNTKIMSLYGDMPLSAQKAVLDRVEQRKIILATNVAETSITIDGVTTVIDSGLARINTFMPALGMNRLQTKRISKASAAQRAGRAGRTGPGNCMRLWSSKEQHMLEDFEIPEIERVELSDCILQLLLWGETRLDKFPWFQKPSTESIESAISLLDALGAIENGKITSRGKEMAKLPLSPRLACLLLEGAGLGALRSASLCCALLGERSPFKRSIDKTLSQVTGMQRICASKSDILDEIDAIARFESSDRKEPHQKIELPGKGYLSGSAAKFILRNAKKTRHEFDSSSKANSFDEEEESLLKAILAAFPDRVCKRRAMGDKRALMVGGKGVMLANQSSVLDSELFVAVDLVDTSKTELIVMRASSIEECWLPKKYLDTRTEVFFDQSLEKVSARKIKIYRDLVLKESAIAIPNHIDPGEILARAVRSSYELDALLDDESKDYLSRVFWLEKEMPSLAIPNLFPDSKSSTEFCDLIEQWCSGCSAIAELRKRPLKPFLDNLLGRDLSLTIDELAPQSIKIANNKYKKLVYSKDSPPVLKARIQEVFGLNDTPRVMRGKTRVLLHLLAPNNRPQQITDDLAGFWKNTYPQVRKDLRGRYPKHSWPENPVK